MTQPDTSVRRRINSERTISGFRIQISREGQPEGWTWLDMRDHNGATAFVGFCREEEIALEIIDHIERARDYSRAQGAPR